MEKTKFVKRKKPELSDQPKEQSQGDQINKQNKIRRESQCSCFVDDGNIFDQGLDDLGGQSFNCLQNLETRVT